MRRLVHDISSVREQPLDNDQVNVLFEALWPRLEEQVKKAKKRAPDFDIARRSSRGMLEELVERTRNIERKGDLAVSGESLNRIYERIKILQSILLRLMNTVAEIGPGLPLPPEPNSQRRLLTQTAACRGLPAHSPMIWTGSSPAPADPYGDDGFVERPSRPVAIQRSRHRACTRSTGQREVGAVRRA
jgi:hypothetical protein